MTNGVLLSRIKFDDQLLFNRNGNIFSRRQGLNNALFAFQVKRKPMRHGFIFYLFQCALHGRFADLSLIGGNYIALLHDIGWDINPFSVYSKVIVPNQLPRGTAGRPQAHAIDDVVHAQLQILQQVFAGDALFPVGSRKVYSELFFQDPIEAFDFLLFSELHPIFGKLFSALTVLTGKVSSLLYRTFRRFTALGFKK